MEAKQVDKIRMFLSVDTVLDENSPLFSASQAVIANHARLKELIESIDGYRQVQEADSSGLTTLKNDLRGALNTLTLRAISALMAYATAIKDTELLAKCTYNKSTLRKKSDTIFVDIAKLIYGLAVPLIDNLGVHFLEQAHLDEMNELIPQLKAAIPQKRLAVGHTVVSTDKIKKTIKTISELLEKEMDVLMEPYQYAQPDFYAAYVSARKIVHYHGTGKKAEEIEPTTVE